MEMHRKLNLAKCLALAISIVAFACLTGLVVMAAVYTSNSSCPPEVGCSQIQPGDVLQPNSYPNGLNILEGNEMVVETSGSSVVMTDTYQSPDDSATQRALPRMRNKMLWFKELFGDQDTAFQRSYETDPNRIYTESAIVINNPEISSENFPSESPVVLPSDSVQRTAQGNPISYSGNDINVDTASDEDDASYIFSEDTLNEAPTPGSQETANLIKIHRTR